MAPLVINIGYNNELNQLTLYFSAEIDRKPKPLFRAPLAKQEKILYRDPIPFELTKGDVDVSIEKTRNALRPETIEYPRDKQPASEYKEPGLEESSQPKPLFSAPPEKQEKIFYRDPVSFELTKEDDDVSIEKTKNALRTETIEYLKDKQPESEYEEPRLEESSQPENLSRGEEMPEIMRSQPDSIEEVEKEHKRSEEEISVDKTINNKKEKSYWKSPSGKMLAIHASISWIGFIIPMLCFASTML